MEHCVRTSVLAIILALTHGILSESPVYFSLFASGGENGFRSSGAIPAVDIALEEIERNQLLPGYNFTYETWRDSKCSRTDALNEFFEEVQSSSAPRIAVIGCGCSASTIPVAEISHHWNITQISFASASSSLSDRTRFKNYFRTTPSFNNYAPAILGLLNKFNWKRLAFITLNEIVFQKVFIDHQGLLQSLKAGTSDKCCFKNHDITTTNVVFQSEDDAVSTAQTLFDENDFHVFLLNCYSLQARKLICEAAKRNLVYPNYGWIIYAWYPERWWTDEIAGVPLNDAECTEADIEDFLKKSRVLLLHIAPEPDDFDEITAAGISTTVFRDMYEDRLKTTNFTANVAYASAFDTTWTLAQALNYTEVMRLNNETDIPNCENMTGELLPLDQFNYSNAYMGCVIKNNMHKVNFTGFLGPVKYGADGTIIYTKIRIAQMRSNEAGQLVRVRYGYLDRDSNFSLQYDQGENDETIFPDGFPPDGTPSHTIHTYKTWLIAIYYFLALCGVIFSLVCLVFNFTFRNRRAIRLTTPSLNFLIICGALLMYLSVLIEFAPSTEKSFIKAQCIIHVWMYGIGYLLVYGTILAKMWRVYQIFHNPTPEKTILKTWHLFCVVAGITGVGVVLIVIKTILQSVTSPNLVTDPENPSGITGSGIREEYSVWQCYASGSPSFVLDLMIFIYLTLLQIVGIILAFQTRKVKITVLNDSKSVATLIYISSVVLIVIVLIKFFLRQFINVSAAVFCGGILLLATFYLILIFCPKMMNLYRDPSGSKIFDGTYPTKNTEHKTTSENQIVAMGIPDLTDAEKIDLLNVRVKGLEEMVKNKNQRIIELEAHYKP